MTLVPSSLRLLSLAHLIIPRHPTTRPYSTIHAPALREPPQRVLTVTVRQLYKIVNYIHMMRKKVIYSEYLDERLTKDGNNRKECFC